MDNKKYNVTILHSQVSESSIAQLAKLFKIPTEKAQQILQKKSFIIKKQTDKNTAEKFYKAITDIDVNCKIDEIIEEAIDVDLPTIELIESNTQVKPLTDITRPDILPLHSENIHLSLSAQPRFDTNSTNNNDVIDDVDAENFCPECGTIRARADSLCLHCGYDPTVIKRRKTKSMLIKAAILIIILGFGAVFSYPYYQQLSKRLQIEDDLALAFNTRNKVTEFIQKTNFWPNQNIDAGLDKQISNRSLKSVLLGENAVMTIIIRAELLGSEEQTLIFTPNILKGRIVWNCLKGDLQETLRPEVCRVHTIE